MVPSLRAFFFSLFLVAIHLGSSSAPALEKIVDYSFDNDTFEVFSSMCPALPDAQGMRAEIDEILRDLRLPRERLERLYLPPSAKAGLAKGAEFPKAANILLDGFALRGISPAHLFVISELTALAEAHEKPFVLRYTSSYRGLSWAVASRGCETQDCINRGLRDGHDFSRLNTRVLCTDVFCAAERLFGKDRAIQTLWLYLKFGITSGPYVSPLADPAGLTPQTLWALGSAASMLPPHLGELAFSGSKFYQYRRDEPIPMYGGRRVVANAAGQVFAGIESYTSFKRVGVFLHELGHRAAQTNGRDQSPEWVLLTKSEFTSLYGFESPIEDFAESFVFYRAKPEYLKWISPKRYEYMKQFFGGLEYDSDLCQGTKAK